MTLSRPQIFLPSFTLSIVLLASCHGEKSVPQADSSSAAIRALPASEPPGANTGWNEDETGPVLLVSVVEAVNQALVVLPFVTDSAKTRVDKARTDSIRATEFELFNHSGQTATATVETVGTSAPSEGCSEWPRAIFREPPSRGWQVGFSYRTAKGLTLDSLENSAPGDSAAITSELARLSSAATAMGDPAFQGLPFTVREAYRLKLQNSLVVIGDVVRSINEEANPREEHLLLIAEKNAADPQYHTAFYSRAAGSEEQVRTNEILAAVRFTRDNRAAIAVSFAYEDGERVALIERIAPGQWKLIWRSAYTGC